MVDICSAIADITSRQTPEEAMRHEVSRHPNAVVEAVNETLMPRGLGDPARAINFSWPYLLVESGGEQALIRLQTFDADREEGVPRGRNRRVTWLFMLEASDWRQTNFRSVDQALNAAPRDATQYRDRYGIPVSFPRHREELALPSTQPYSNKPWAR